MKCQTESCQRRMAHSIMMYGKEMKVHLCSICWETVKLKLGEGHPSKVENVNFENKVLICYEGDCTKNAESDYVFCKDHIVPESIPPEENLWPLHLLNNLESNPLADKKKCYIDGCDNEPRFTYRSIIEGNLKFICSVCYGVLNTDFTDLEHKSTRDLNDPGVKGAMAGTALKEKLKKDFEQGQSNHEAVLGAMAAPTLKKKLFPDDICMKPYCIQTVVSGYSYCIEHGELNVQFGPKDVDEGKCERTNCFNMAAQSSFFCSDHMPDRKATKDIRCGRFSCFNIPESGSFFCSDHRGSPDLKSTDKVECYKLDCHILVESGSYYCSAHIPDEAPDHMTDQDTIKELTCRDCGYFKMCHKLKELRQCVFDLTNYSDIEITFSVLPNTCKDYKEE